MSDFGIGFREYSTRENTCLNATQAAADDGSVFHWLLENGHGIGEAAREAPQRILLEQRILGLYYGVNLQGRRVFFFLGGVDFNSNIEA